MKLSQLRQIIKEEIQSALNEAASMKPLDHAKFEQIMNKAKELKLFYYPRDAKDWVTGVKILEPMIKKGFNDAYLDLDRKQQDQFDRKVIPLFQTFENLNNRIKDPSLRKKWVKMGDALSFFTNVFGTDLMLGGESDEEGIAAWNAIVQAVNSFEL